jgi:hypothetical protein
MYVQLILRFFLSEFVQGFAKSITETLCTQFTSMILEAKVLNKMAVT